MNLLAIKAIAAAILALGAFYGGYKAGSLSGEAKVSELEKNAAIERLAAQTLLNQEVIDNDLLKDQLHRQAIENQKALDAARKRLADSRVFLPAAVCADYGQVDAAGGSVAAATGAGVLSDQAGGAQEEAQRALDEFNAENDTDSAAADGVVEMCRPVFQWAK